MSRRSRRKKLLRQLQPDEKAPVEEAPVEKKEEVRGLADFYEKKYMLLMIIPLVLLILALAQIGVQYATTGDFLNKGVSLKGGITVTIPTDEQLDARDIQGFLEDEFPGLDINVRVLKSVGELVGISIEADADTGQMNDFLRAIEEKTGISKDLFGIEQIGSSLGDSFFRETLFAIMIAFLFMGIVVFFYFRTVVPSVAVILAAFSDIVITLAIVNLLGIKLSSSGIAAFLMLIGYSVDTDILLSTKVLKRKEGTVSERVYSAMKTGMTMTMTTIAAVTVGLIFSKSAVLQQIMTILLIGLIVDIINTWIQNVGIIRWYMDRGHKIEQNK
ncbi:MAG: protein translocase subunit SecF [archaeon]